MKKKLFLKIDNLCNLCKFEDAEKVAIDLYKNLENFDIKEKFQIACYLIDIGNRTKNSYPNYCGLKILKKNKKNYLKYYHISSYEYNLGNAYSGIFQSKEKKLTNLKDFRALIDSKKYFWRANKHIKNPKILKFKYINNLANSLKKCYRISEALYYYNIILKKRKTFYQANISKIECLKLLETISSSNNNLYYEIYKCYLNARKNKEISLNERKFLEKELSEFIENSKEKNIHYNNILKKNKHSLLEQKKHNNLRKTLLKHNLDLSENGLYSKCCGSRKDNLSIFTVNNQTKNKNYLRMEIYLNEIKSEFNLLRVLYLESKKELKKISKLDEEITFKLILKNHKTDIKTNYLKNVNKACFNILDKIAFAICDLYNLSTKNNKIYFESFWWDKKINNKLTLILNPGLIGLYSIATDINNKNGELSFFKKWRNNIEHNFLIIIENSKFLTNSKLFFNENIICIEEDEFKDNISTLIQVVRSAIFCFTWCVRYEVLKENYIDTIKMEKNQ